MMEQEKENRDLAIDGDSEDADTDAQHRTTGGLFSNPGKQTRQKQILNSTGEYGNDRPSKPPNLNSSQNSGPQQAQQARRVQSRGRVQINAPQKNPPMGQNVPVHLRWSQIEPAQSYMGTSNEYNNGSQSHLMMSPDPSLLSKNSKAMAQLAPLDKPVIVNQMTSGQGKSGVNIPSLEQLQ